jgi:tRNA pseudouridine32 synthase / 23S rRNA pseudouridine746 synthase
LNINSAIFTEDTYFKPDIARIKSTLLTHYWDLKVYEPPNKNSLLLSQIISVELAKRGLNKPFNYWQQQLTVGSIFLNGESVNEDIVINKFPVRLEFYEPKYDVAKIETIFPPFSLDSIVFEDKHLLVYLKPHGLPCVPAREQTLYNLRSYLDKYVGREVHMPSRLDMSTMGLVPVSKTRLAHNSLQQAFQNRRVQKRYRLLSPTPEWQSITVKTFITKHPEHPVLRTCSKTVGKEALTKFRILKIVESGKTALIEAHPITGRTHQIRVHAQYLGLPIVGDNFYSGLQAKELHLMCYSLSFPHPITNLPFNCKIPYSFLPDWAKI